MQEDYIEEDFLEEESSSNRRPFLMAVGVLVSLFILMGACTAFFLVRNRAAVDRAAEVAVRETRNAETLASNSATAIAATDTAAAIPTNTTEPTAAPTETPAPPTPVPTNTPVVDNVDEEEALAELENDNAADNEAESTENGEDTAVSDGETDTTNGGKGTDDGSTADGDATPTPISALSETGDNTGDALPQTGLDTWGVVVTAFVLVGLLIFARRLRTAS